MGEVTLPGGLALEHGEVLEPCRVSYELVGRAGAPVVAALGGISASRHLLAHRRDPGEGWWEAQAGPGRPLDPDRVRLLGIEWVHGARGGEPLAVTPADQARALVGVLDHVGVEGLAAAVGASYGGMVALALAAHHGRRLERAVILCAAHESHPMATAWRALQRRIVRLGMETGRVRESVETARGLAMTTYRSADEFRERFDGAPAVSGGPLRSGEGGPGEGRAGSASAGARFPVEDYLEARGREFARRFSPARFLCLCQSLDLHRVDPARIEVPVTLVSVDRDALVPPWQMRELHDALVGETELVTLSSPRGHDAFLTDEDAVARILFDALEPLGASHVSDAS